MVIFTLRVNMCYAFLLHRYNSKQIYELKTMRISIVITCNIEKSTNVYINSFTDLFIYSSTTQVDEKSGLGRENNFGLWKQVSRAHSGLERV